MKSHVIDLEVMVHHATEKAVLVSVDGNRDGAAWLPFSLVDLEEEPVAGRAQIVTLPERLAVEKGLV